jgi:hypothetical protein
MVKLPREPGPLTIDDKDLVDWPNAKMVRIHGTVGPHALPWHQLRHFGPAHAIAVHPQSVDGVLYTSSMTGASATALFLPAADSFPPHPDLSLPLNDPGIVGALDAAAQRIKYAIT